ncbi:hypothetical protein GCM10027270_07160 [Nocardioides ginkgobilobae]
MWALLVTSIYASTASVANLSNDVLSASLAAWRIATAGTPWFDGFPLDLVPTKEGQSLWTGEAENGHLAVFRSPGAIAVGVPAYFLRGGGTAVEDFSLVPAAATAVALTLGSLLLFASTLRPLLGPARTMVAVTALGLATPVWTVNAESLWPHSLTTFAIAGMAWASSRDKWWLAGLFGGIGLWGRLHVSAIAAAVGVGNALRRRSLFVVLAVGMPSATFMVMAAIWSRWMYGEWDPAGGYATVATYASNASEESRANQILNFAGLWISPGRGLLVLTPCVLLLLPALVRSWRDLPGWSRTLLVSGLLYAVIQGLLNFFAGGAGFFGYRLTLETLACMFPALALSVERAGRTARAALPPLLAVQVGVYAFAAARNAYSISPDDAWRINPVLVAVGDVPALGVMLLLLAGVAALACRMTPDSWSWPTPRRPGSAPQQAHQRG